MIPCESRITRRGLRSLVSAAGVASADDFDLRDAGRVERKDALDAFVRDDAPDGDHLVDAATLLSDEDALIDLDALLVAFDDAHVHVDRVADGEVGNLSFGLELIGDDGFEGLLLVHGSVLKRGLQAWRFGA